MVIEHPKNPYRGMIEARLFFAYDAFLDVLEHVWIDERGTPSRRKYSYHFQVDGVYLERYDFDPELPPSKQHHTNRPSEMGNHEPSERITLTKAVEQCWEIRDSFQAGEIQVD